MPNNSTISSRHQRATPYLLDELAVTFHRSAAGMAWRWRTEFTVAVTVTAAYLRLAYYWNWIWAAVAIGVIVVPATRRFVTRRFWCVLSRHRIQRLCWEVRLHTRAGRLPLVLWTRPTKVGERAWLICRAGICAEDFEDHVGELRAACYARDARVTRNLRWSQLVTIDIIRRDTLAASHEVASPLASLHARHLRALATAAAPTAGPGLADIELADTGT